MDIELQTIDEQLQYFTERKFKYYMKSARSGMIYVTLEPVDYRAIFKPDDKITFKIMLDKVLTMEMYRFDRNTGIERCIIYSEQNGMVTNILTDQKLDMNRQYYKVVSTEEEYFQQSMIDEYANMYSIEAFDAIKNLYAEYYPIAMLKYTEAINGKVNT